MKKILLVSDTYNAYGVEKIIIWLGVGLSKKGHNVTFCSLYDKKRTDGIPVELPCICLGINNYENNYYFNNLSYFSIVFFRLRQIIRKGKFDYIVSFGQNSLIILSWLKRWYNFKIVLSERNDPFSRTSFFENFRKRYYKYADTIVFQTEGARGYFPESIKRKSLVIPNFVVIPDEEWSIDCCTKKIVNVSRLDIRQKRLDLLIRAFAIVHSRHPDYILEVYGEGPFEDQLKELSKELHLEQSVFFPGKTSQVKKVLLDSEIFVLSSDFEGMPNALMEAMAIGMPVVSTDCSPGGAKALIDNEKSGLLVERGNVLGLANAIDELICDKQKAMNYGIEARLKMREFAPDIILDAWEKCFR